MAYLFILKMVGATGFEPAWDFSRDVLSVMCKPFHHTPIVPVLFLSDTLWLVS